MEIKPLLTEEQQKELDITNRILSCGNTINKAIT